MGNLTFSTSILLAHFCLVVSTHTHKCKQQTLSARSHGNIWNLYMYVHILHVNVSLTLRTGSFANDLSFVWSQSWRLISIQSNGKLSMQMEKFSVALVSSFGVHNQLVLFRLSAVSVARRNIPESNIFCFQNSVSANILLECAIKLYRMFKRLSIYWFRFAHVLSKTLHWIHQGIQVSCADKMSAMSFSLCVSTTCSSETKLEKKTPKTPPQFTYAAKCALKKRNKSIFEQDGKKYIEKFDRKVYHLIGLSSMIY